MKSESKSDIVPALPSKLSPEDLAAMMLLTSRLETEAARAELAQTRALHLNAERNAIGARYQMGDGDSWSPDGTIKRAK